MTFTEMVAKVCRVMNLRGDETMQRVGEAINHRYKRVIRSLGMNIYSRTEVDIDLEAGTQDQIYDLDDPVLGRLVALFYTPDATTDNPNPRSEMLDEITYEEMKTVVPSTDRPRRWCKVRVGSNWTLFKIDSTIPDGMTLTVEGEEIPTELEGDMEPGFDQNFHEMLIIGAEADEYGRQKTADARAMAKQLNDEFDREMGELRLKQTLMAGGVIKQGKHSVYRNPLARRGVPSDNNR